MKTEVVDVSPTRKELRIEIDVESVRAEYDRVSDRYAKQAAVPGFRPGRAPRSLVRQRYKKEIRGEVLRELVPPALAEALTESKLRVIGEPDVRLDNEDSSNQLGEHPLAIQAQVEVLPEITLGEYRNLELVRRVRPVVDKDVEEVIESLRESASSLQPVEDRPAQLGDTVTVTFRGEFVDTPEAEPINVEDVDVELGSEGVLPEMTDNLLGTRPDDGKEFTIHYPEDFSARGLAGKAVKYTADITAVRIRELPEPDDEWAKSIDESIDSLIGLRERVRTNLTEQAQYEMERRLRDAVIDKLIERHQFEVPPTLLEAQLQGLLQQTVRDMMARGINPRQAEINWKALQENLREEAGPQVRGSLVLELIADKENIEVTDEEITEEVTKLAQSVRQTPEQVRAALTKQDGERSIANRLRMRKTLDLLIENAQITDKEWREEDDDDIDAGALASDAQPRGGSGGGDAPAAAVVAEESKAPQDVAAVAVAGEKSSSSEEG